MYSFPDYKLAIYISVSPILQACQRCFQNYLKHSRTYISNKFICMYFGHTFGYPGGRYVPPPRHYIDYKTQFYLTLLSFIVLRNAIGFGSKGPGFAGKRQLVFERFPHSPMNNQSFSSLIYHKTSFQYYEQYKATNFFSIDQETILTCKENCYSGCTYLRNLIH